MLWLYSDKNDIKNISAAAYVCVTARSVFHWWHAPAGTDLLFMAPFSSNLYISRSLFSMAILAYIVNGLNVLYCFMS